MEVVQILLRCCLLGGLVALLIGCGYKNQTTPSAAVANLSADELWAQTLAAYKAAKSYRDLGVVRLTYTQAGKPVSSEAEVSLRFSRPNKLRLQAYQVQMSCDGKELRARITDAATNDLDGQFVARPAPEKLTPSELYGDELLHAQIGNGVIQAGLLSEPMQVELLCADRPFSGLGEISERKLLGAATFDGHACQQLSVTTTKGTFVFWIDAAKLLVRRVEYPREMLLAELKNSADIQDVKLVADFLDARFNDEIGENLFSLDVPKDAKLVRFFVPPPQRLPSDLFGKATGPFAFKRLDAGSISQADLLGKVAVLIWFNDYPACEKTLQSLAQFHTAWQRRDEVSVLAICTEPSEFSDQQIRDLLKKWQVDLPVARDLDAIGRDLFHIEGAPTLIVLDRQGVVQVVETGGNPDLAKELQNVLEQILKGEVVSQRVLDQHEQERRLYARQLAIASGTGSTRVIEIPQTPIKPRSEPKHLKLTPRWTSHDLSAPGNLLVVGEPNQASIVVAGGQTICVLDREGKPVARHELSLPGKASISFVRTFLSAENKRWFVAAAPMNQQAFVLDADWKQVLAYPPTDQPHDGLRDAWLEDVGEEGGAALYVGFWGTLGVQRVTLDGQRQWSNRTIPSVMSLAFSHPHEISRRKILVAGDQGQLLRLNHLGHHEPPFFVRDRKLTQLYASRFGASHPTIYCGVAFSPEGNLLAVALDAELNEEWNYPFPAGLHRNQIEYVTSGSVRSATSAEWIFAAADGSIHIVSSDGQFLDYFNFGEPLTGIAHTRFGEESVLLVSTSKSVTAWTLQP